MKVQQRTAARAVRFLDRLYEAAAAFTGGTPYAGEKIRFFPDPTIRPYGYLLAGNPVRFDPAMLTGEPWQGNIFATCEPGYDEGEIAYGFAHEIGHDFTIDVADGRRYMIGDGLVEGWANVVGYAIQGELGFIPNTPGVLFDDKCIARAAEHATSGTYTDLLLRDGASLAGCMLLEVARNAGWDGYRRFFQARLESDDASPSINDPAEVRWRWVRDRLSEAMESDVTPILARYHVPL